MSAWTYRMPTPRRRRRARLRRVLVDAALALLCTAVLAVLGLMWEPGR
jgi:hypothetical protein